jgi:hypothetical protein
MLVVALAAVSVWGLKLWRLSTDYATRARRHQAAEALYRLAAVELSSSPALYEQTPGSIPLSTADYHAAMARKYERAAPFPWLTVEPDPPEP